MPRLYAFRIDRPSSRLSFSLYVENFFSLSLDFSTVCVCVCAPVEPDAVEQSDALKEGEFKKARRV